MHLLRLLGFFIPVLAFGHVYSRSWLTAHSTRREKSHLFRALPCMKRVRDQFRFQGRLSTGGQADIALRAAPLIDHLGTTLELLPPAA